MNSQQRRRDDRYRRKMGEEFLQLLMEMRNEIVEKKMTIEEFVELVDDLIELRNEHE